VGSGAIRRISSRDGPGAGIGPATGSRPDESTQAAMKCTQRGWTDRAAGRRARSAAPRSDRALAIHRNPLAPGWAAA